MIETGDYERHVNRYRKAQREVRDAFVDEMVRLAPSGRVRVEQADSGLHFVLSIEGADEDRITAAALERECGFRPWTIMRSLRHRLTMMRVLPISTAGWTSNRPARPPASSLAA